MSMKSVLVFSLLAATPAQAGLCFQGGEPAKILDVWRESFHMRSIVKMNVLAADGNMMPGIIMAAPDGKFTILILRGDNTVCEVAEGAGMAPAAADLNFPGDAAPAAKPPIDGKPKPEERGT